jgi:DNA-binding MarR family transcriptional regulator
MTRPRPISPRELWRLNFQVLSSCMAEIAPRVRELDLEIKEFFLLDQLDTHPYPAELARELLMPRPTVTVLIKRMEAAGYLKRDLDPGDLRRFRLTLTTPGRRAMDQARALLDEAFGRRVARLTKPQLAELVRSLQRMA